MNNKRTLLIVAAAFALLLAGAVVIYGILGQNAVPEQTAGPWGTEESERVQAPDFTVYDVDGTEVRLSDFIGKPIVLNFWASWCGPCRSEMPYFEDAYAEQGADVQFLMVNMTSGRESLQNAAAFIEDQGFTFPVFYDTEADAAETYGISSLPTTVFIDAEGNIAGQVIGAINGAALQMGIDSILSDDSADIPEYAADIQGIKKYNEVVDYSDSENWAMKPKASNKPVDVIYFYPTRYYVDGPEDDELCDIDHKGMREKAVNVAQKHTGVFAESCNVYVPFYRQLSVPCILKLIEEDSKALGYCASQDMSSALDYYFKEYNDGRPFILAGHSQGSIMLCEVLSDYMKAHPEYLENMVAAYIIGFSVTEQYLADNPHLKFAEGSDDTGVIVSYNTEGTGNKNEYNGVVKEGSIAINPVNWKRDETYAPASENLGSLDKDMSITDGLADARIDLERGVVICESADHEEYASKSVDCFGPDSYHSNDYSFYYMNLKENVADRIEAFLKP